MTLCTLSRLAADNCAMVLTMRACSMVVTNGLSTEGLTSPVACGIDNLNQLTATVRCRGHADPRCPRQHDQRRSEYHGVRRREESRLDRQWGQGDRLHLRRCQHQGQPEYAYRYHPRAVQPDG